MTPSDKLVDCKCCNSNACYESKFKTQEEEILTWLCMTCGFTTNTTMEVESDVLKQAEELTAELIRDLKQTHENLAWFPTGTKNQYCQKRMDMKNPIRFEKLEFMDAAAELGMFNIPQKETANED